LRLASVAFEAEDPAALSRFWAEALGRPTVADDRGVLVPGDGSQLSLRFVASPRAKSQQNRIHLHLTSTSLDDQQATVAKAVGLGARHIDIGQRPEEGHIVLADPEGNEFCVIEPGNSFLAGCGFLGELACHGTRDVGVFWSAALQLPLVWDRDEETAVQLPPSGTKIAWGGQPAPPTRDADRQHFELVVVDSDHSAEAARLVSLGAGLLGEIPGGVVLTDPDGLPFTLLTG
jgi:catechol 2,3-dioxygenase-like lactoylglutathione lyase family enzyme